MRNNGLEWLHRLAGQPRRLGPRYLHTNLMFLAKTVTEAARGLRRGRMPQAPTAAAVVIGTADALTPGHRPRAGLDLGPFNTLVMRIEASLASEPARLIGFIGSAGGEGTSTVARAYVAAAAARSSRRVLLLQMQGQDGPGGQGVIQALAAGQPLQPLAQPLPDGGMVASLGAADTAMAVNALVANRALWAELRCQFDDIVIDLPSAHNTAHGSALGLGLAHLCDGVVLVLEAAKTRAPLARQRVAELRAVHANVLGTVLNKRRMPALAASHRGL